MISYGDITNGSTIYTHTPCAIFLRKQKNRYNTRAKTLTYIPAFQKVLNLSLNFLSLLRVGPIGNSFLVKLLQESSQSGVQSL